MARDVSIVIKAASKVRTAFKKLSRRFRQFRGRIKAWATGLNRMFAKVGRGIVRIGAAVLAASAVAVRAFIKQEEAETKLEAVLRATGHAAGFTSKQLRTIASDLQKATKFGDETVLGLQTILGTFKEIRGDEFKKATELVLDMATALGQDARSAAIQVGKALNDPIKGVTALGRAGVQFTDKQKEMIKTFVEQGQIVKAQAIVLKELEQQFGGTARAAKQTFGGAIADVKNNFGDLLEAFGEVLAKSPAIQNAFRGIANWLSESTGKLKEFAESGRFDDLITSISIFFAEFVKGWKKVGIVASSTFKLIKKAVIDLNSIIAKPFEKLGQRAAENEVIRQRFRIEKRDQGGGHVSRKRQKEIIKEVRKEFADRAAAAEKTSKDTEAVWTEMFAKLEQLEADHEAKLDAILAKRHAAEMGRAAQRIDAVKSEIDEIIAAGQAQTAEQREALELFDKIIEGEEKIVELEKKRGDEANKKATQKAAKEQLETLEKQISKIEELIEKEKERQRIGFDEFGAEQKAEAEKRTRLEDVLRREQDLAKKAERGIKLSRKDQEFMDQIAAWRQAQKDAAEKQRALEARKKALANEAQRLQEKIAKLAEKQTKELVKIREQQTKLLTLAP